VRVSRPSNVEAGKDSKTSAPPEAWIAGFFPKDLGRSFEKLQQVVRRMILPAFLQISFAARRNDDFGGSPEVKKRQIWKELSISFDLTFRAFFRL
jgi:hypothetical protein